MRKIVAETTGDFLLSDPTTGDVLESHRPCVISKSTFIDRRVNSDQVKNLGDAPEGMTDADFEKAWNEKLAEEDADPAEVRAELVETLKAQTVEATKAGAKTKVKPATEAGKK